MRYVKCFDSTELPDEVAFAFEQQTEENTSGEYIEWNPTNIGIDTEFISENEKIVDNWLVTNGHTDDIVWIRKE